MELLLQDEDASQWDECLVSQDEVDTEKEFFRKAMTVGIENLDVENMQQLESTEDATLVVI